MSSKSKKFDFNEFIKDWQIYDLDLFKSYLTEIWLDLRLRKYIEVYINRYL